MSRRLAPFDAPAPDARRPPGQRLRWSVAVAACGLAALAASFLLPLIPPSVSAINQAAELALAFGLWALLGVAGGLACRRPGPRRWCGVAVLGGLGVGAIAGLATLAAYYSTPG